MNDKMPPVDILRKVIRKLTIDMKILPVFCGSAYKNKGVQPVLDAVCEYLPSPNQRKCVAYQSDDSGKEEEIELNTSDAKAPFVGLAFKLETNQYGQLT